MSTARVSLSASAALFVLLGAASGAAASERASEAQCRRALEHLSSLDGSRVDGPRIAACQQHTSYYAACVQAADTSIDAQECGDEPRMFVGYHEPGGLFGAIGVALAIPQSDSDYADEREAGFAVDLRVGYLMPRGRLGFGGELRGSRTQLPLPQSLDGFDTLESYRHRAWVAGLLSYAITDASRVLVSCGAGFDRETYERTRLLADVTWAPVGYASAGVQIGAHGNAANIGAEIGTPLTLRDEGVAVDLELRIAVGLGF